MNLTLPVVTSAALLDSINPCAISVLLLTIGFLISLEKNRSQVFKIAGLYIFGIFITYILVGLGVLSALTFFGIPKAISKIGAGIIIFTGVLGLSKVPLGIPAFIKPQLARLMQKATLPAMFGLGVLVGLFEFPCTGGPYLLILSLLHDKSTFTSGALYLIYYNFIFVLPLIIILALSNSKIALDRVQSWRKSNLKIADTVASIAMILLGAIIFFL